MARYRRVALCAWLLLAVGCSGGDDAAVTDESTTVAQATTVVAPASTQAPSSTTSDPVAPTTTVSQQGLTVAVVGTSPGGANRNYPYVLIDVDDEGLAFVAYFVNDTGELRFVHCLNVDCSQTTEGGVYSVDQPGWLGGWPSIGRDTDGLPVIGVGPSIPVGPDGESWTSILACADPACIDYSETRVYGVGFYALEVEADGATTAIGYDPKAAEAQGGGADGFELMLCEDPTCDQGPTRIDVDGWNHFGPPHRLAIMNGNPIASYLQSFSESPAVGLIECLDSLCEQVRSTVVGNSSDHALAAGPAGPAALLRDVFSPQSWLHRGLVLDVWDTTFAEATTVELYDPTRLDVTASFGAGSVAVGIDGAPAAVWVRDVYNGPAENAPEVALAYSGIDVAALDELPGEVLREFDITATDGLFVDEPIPGAAGNLAGLMLGDVIVAIDGVPILIEADLYRIENESRPGQLLAIDYERRGQPASTQLILAAGYSELVLARCDDSSCDSGTMATIVQASLQQLSFWASLDIDPNNNPLVVYRDPADVIVARCVDPACATNAIEIQRW